MILPGLMRLLQSYLAKRSKTTLPSLRHFAVTPVLLRHLPAGVKRPAAAGHEAVRKGFLKKPAAVAATASRSAGLTHEGVSGQRSSRPGSRSRSVLSVLPSRRHSAPMPPRQCTMSGFRVAVASSAAGREWPRTTSSAVIRATPSKNHGNFDRMCRSDAQQAEPKLVGLTDRTKAFVRVYINKHESGRTQQLLQFQDSWFRWVGVFSDRGLGGFWHLCGPPFQS